MGGAYDQRTRSWSGAGAVLASGSDGCPVPWPRPSSATTVGGRAEIIRECLQVVVVQTKLQLEGTIGHAAAALKHGQRVIQHLLEGHRRPSIPRTALEEYLESPARRAIIYHIEPQCVHTCLPNCVSNWLT